MERRLKVSSLIEHFYRNGGYPYHIFEILEWSNEKWEDHHDFIQWIFPTTTPSKFNLSAPVLDDTAAKILKVYTDTILKLVNKFKEFIIATDALGCLNHNYLRVSRVIQFLMEIGMRDEAEKFLIFAESKAGHNDFWSRAIKSQPLI